MTMKSIRKMTPKERLALHRRKTAAQDKVAEIVRKIVLEPSRDFSARVAGMEDTVRMFAANGSISHAQAAGIRKIIAAKMRRLGVKEVQQ